MIMGSKEKVFRAGSKMQLVCVLTFETYLSADVVLTFENLSF